MLLMLALTTLFAQAPPIPGALGAAAKLADSLRDLIVHNLPEPLYVKTHNWDHKEPAFSRVQWKGPDGHPKVLRVEKEEGEWTKFQAFALNTTKDLRLNLTNLQLPGEGKTTFDLEFSLPVRFLFERQIWKSGVRLYSGSAKGRLRLALTMHCEVTAGLEKGKLLPDLVFRLRATGAQVAYDQFVLEHIAGFGGEVAKDVGKLVRKAIHQWKPSIERELLAKANAALCKAADSREIRVGLDGLRRSTKQ
jgi:hypothetical protein